MKKNDILVIFLCDGIAKIPQTFIDYLTELKALDINLLRDKGYATLNKQTGRYEMKEIEDIMDEGLDQYPSNILHLFGTQTCDFDLKNDDEFRGRKINFMFGLKHINNGKINSLKWML